MNLEEAQKAVEDRIESDPANMFKVYEISEKELFEISDELAQRVTLRLVFGSMRDPYDAMVALGGTAMSLGIAMGMEIERAKTESS